MFDIMGRHYDRIKEEVGLNDPQENSDDDEQLTEAIYKRLRPQSKHNLKRILSTKDPKQAQRMMGPMAVMAFDHGHEVDVRQRKKKIERHRFAEPPENSRSLHNQMMLKNEHVPEVATVIEAPSGYLRGLSQHNTELKLQKNHGQMSSRSNLRPFTAADGHKHASSRGLRYSTATSIPHLQIQPNANDVHQ